MYFYVYFYVYFFVIAGIFANQNVFANCEAGAYSIHTVAEYPDKTDPKHAFVEYKVGATKFSLARVPKGAKIQRLIYNGDECKLEKKEFKNDDMDPFTTFYSLKSCQKLAAAIPKHGYGFADFEKGVIRISVDLDLRKLASIGAIEKQIDFSLATIKLYAFHPLLSSAGPRGLIRYSDIISRRFEHIVAGSMTVSIVNLRLMGAAKLFEIQDLKSKTVDFPVIYLTRGGDTPKYIADGSECSSNRLLKKSTSAKGHGVPAIDRFKLTRALDDDGDGFPDLLEINESVVYRLDKDGSLWVVKYFEGC